MLNFLEKSSVLNQEQDKNSTGMIANCENKKPAECEHLCEQASGNLLGTNFPTMSDLSTSTTSIKLLEVEKSNRSQADHDRRQLSLAQRRQSNLEVRKQ